MPLKGTDDALAEALYGAATSSGGKSKEAWRAVANALLTHILGNALVTGVAPSGGGPIVEGKIQ